MNKERFLVPSHGPDISAVAIGVEALTVLCEKYNSNGLILVPALKHAPNTVLNRVWPERQVKLLASGNTLKFSDSHSVSICSPLTLKNHSSSPLILALFASEGMIEKAEKAWGCKALVIVPWIPEDAGPWVKRYAPKTLSLPAQD